MRPEILPDISLIILIEMKEYDRFSYHGSRFSSFNWVMRRVKTGRSSDPRIRKIDDLKLILGDNLQG